MTLTAYAITRPGKEAVLFREKPNAERWIANAGYASAKLVELTAPLERMAQVEPVAWMLDDGEDRELNSCSEFSSGRTGGAPLYAAPRLPRDVLMAVAREVRSKQIQIVREGLLVGRLIDDIDDAVSGIDLDAIVDRHSDSTEQNSSCTFNATSEETPSAVLSYRLKASTGYECEGRQEGITPEQWGRICKVLAAAESAEKSAQAELLSNETGWCSSCCVETGTVRHCDVCGAPTKAIAAAESAQAQQPVAGGSKFFAYDDETGFDLFDSAVDAKKAAQASIDEWRAIADCDGWPEEIENVCWGVVLGASKEIRTGDVGDGSGDWYSDYTIADIAQAQEGGAE